MSTMNFPLEEIEKILSSLGYTKIERISIDTINNMVWYEGEIDTEYRIQVIFKDEHSMEIWDCDYYTNNYVRAGLAIFKNGEWEMTVG